MLSLKVAMSCYIKHSCRDPLFETIIDTFKHSCSDPSLQNASIGDSWGITYLRKQGLFSAQNPSGSFQVVALHAYGCHSLKGANYCTESHQRSILKDVGSGCSLYCVETCLLPFNSLSLDSYSRFQAFHDWLKVTFILKHVSLIDWIIGEDSYNPVWKKTLFELYSNFSLSMEFKAVVDDYKRKSIPNSDAKVYELGRGDHRSTRSNHCAYHHSMIM